MVKSEPSIRAGRRRPDASGSPSVIRRHVSSKVGQAPTFRGAPAPPAARCVRLRPRRPPLRPSAKASPAGCGDRGPHVLRAQPRRRSGRSPWRCCRRRSPPHRGPVTGGLPLATRSRNSIPASACSSPSQRSPCARCAPIARKTASCVCARSPKVKSAPALAHLEPRAEPADGVDLRIERVLRQAVGGDSVAQHAAGERMRVEERAGVAFAADTRRRPDPRDPRRRWRPTSR
jgi:hypothetical protein